jgi:hypothetical protein
MMRNARLMLALTGAVALMAISAGVLAQNAPDQSTELPSRYQVEVIIFRHLDQSRNTPETPAAASMIEASPFDLASSDLPMENGSPTREQARATAVGPNIVDAGRPKLKLEPTVSFCLLPLTLEFPDFFPFGGDDYRLNPVYKRIERLDAYEPILHAGWIQPVKNTDEAQPFMVSAGLDTPVGITGSVTLYKERYLHLAMNLALVSPPDERAADPLNPEPPERVFGAGMFVEPTPAVAPDKEIHRLQESRRIRLATTHYFDHPLFGVIATVHEIKTVANPGAVASESG